MPDKKFNPIANLPTPTNLPGTITLDEELTGKDVVRPKVEIPIKPTEVVEIEDQTPDGRRITIVRTTILLSLIALVLVGIFLTLEVVPMIMNSVYNANQSVISLLTSKKTPSTTATSTAKKIPAYAPLVATSTPINQVANPAISNATSSQTISEPKTPAKLTAVIMSTEVIGAQTFVKFNVQNVGGQTSGPWSFVATLPSDSTPTYNSQVESPLTPYSGVIFTIGFIADQDLPIQITILN